MDRSSKAVLRRPRVMQASAVPGAGGRARVVAVSRLSARGAVIMWLGASALVWAALVWAALALGTRVLI